MDWYLGALKKYADFTGRARRTELWMFLLINFVVSVVLAVVDRMIGTMVLQPLYALAVLLPSLAVGARRLHDTGRSGWWLLIALVPIAGLVVLIVFYLIEGTKGPNAYGPDPKASAAPATA